MPNPTYRRWTADDIADLKNMAQQQPTADIAAQLSRSLPATIFKAHKVRVSLRVRGHSREEPHPSADTNERVK